MLRARVQSSATSLHRAVPRCPGERRLRDRRIQATNRSAATVTNRPSCRLLASRNPRAEVSALFRSRRVGGRRNVKRHRRRRRRRLSMRPAADPATLPVTFIIVHLLESSLFSSFHNSLALLVPSLLNRTSERQNVAQLVLSSTVRTVSSCRPPLRDYPRNIAKMCIIRSLRLWLIVG